MNFKHKQIGDVVSLTISSNNSEVEVNNLTNPILIEWDVSFLFQDKEYSDKVSFYFFKLF